MRLNLTALGRYSLALAAATFAAVAVTGFAADPPKPNARTKTIVQPENLGAESTPNWVWTPGKTADDQAVLFRKTFDIDASPELVKDMTVKFWGSADNVLNVSINGQSIGASSDWERPMSHDISKLVKPGKNVVTIRADNQGGAAGMIARIDIGGKGLKTSYVLTDGTWKFLDVTGQPKDAAVVADSAKPDFDDAAWKDVRVVGKLGIGPWGGALAAAGGGAPRRGGNQSGVATPAEDLKLLPGFKAELLYSVPKATQGSWVAMTTDPKGRLICSDQNGPLYRVTVGATPADTKVEKIDQPIGHAQGLLYTDNALYVVVNGKGIAGNGSGMYRLTDTDNDDQYDKLETLIKFSGAGEHGPHAVRKGADGKLYVIAGNFTKPPERLSPNSQFRNFAEDLLLPRNPDGGGHDPNVMAPAGWIARCDLDGKQFEFLSAGQRNAYDFDFNAFGDIFTYDSDMEWDIGSPWYRPTRILMLTSGGEHGWRNGTGKWPDYYPDSLPAVANTGKGSPTGAAFGYGARFPAKYQHAYYAADWAYGTLYAVHIAAQGAGYTATFEPFAVAKGWALTDVLVGADGALYATIGGRGTQSGLYRITYTGPENTSPAAPPTDAATAQARDTRRKLESFHGRQDPAAVSTALP
ncbi:MAG TPA: hypothetical protein VEA69_13550, partial [Tepidisphaeraceae bacterium]|nr:hypothetical protein [Tepidisphaeraceae bacterium]